jgi:hypothetical protein
MGCDFYIIKFLNIYYNNKTESFIDLDREKGYYHYWFDEDEEDYEKKRKEYIESVLEPHMKPILIYEENQFVRPLFETKYKSIIEKELNQHYKSWENIEKIEKREERYERG